jgi:Tfp pilus assembly protein PilV
LRYWNRLQQVKKQTPSAKGFTLIETLIAGLLLTLVMTAVGRMSVSALAGSSNISDRRRIEQAIENHIQLIQQADSLLTYDNVPATHRNGETGVTRACRKPAEYLARALNQKGLISNDDWRSNSAEANLQLFPSFPDPGRDLNDVILNEAIKETDYSYDEDKAIVTITYTFEAPEANVGLEKRILELSPNFQSACTPYEATGT